MQVHDIVNKMPVIVFSHIVNISLLLMKLEQRVFVQLWFVRNFEIVQILRGCSGDQCVNYTKVQLQERYATLNNIMADRPFLFCSENFSNL